MCVCVLFAIQWCDVYERLRHVFTQQQHQIISFSHAATSIVYIPIPIYGANEMKKKKQNFKRNLYLPFELQTHSISHILASRYHRHKYENYSMAFCECVCIHEMWLIMQCMIVRYGFNFILTPFAGELAARCARCWIRLTSPSLNSCIYPTRSHSLYGFTTISVILFFSLFILCRMCKAKDIIRFMCVLSLGGGDGVYCCCCCCHMKYFKARHVCYVYCIFHFYYAHCVLSV